MPYLHVATPLDRSSQLWLHPSFLKREVRNTRTKKGRRQEGSRPQQGLEITGRRQTPVTQDSRQIEGAEDAHGRAIQEARRFQDPCRCPAGQCGRFVQRAGSIRRHEATECVRVVQLRGQCLARQGNGRSAHVDVGTPPHSCTRLGVSSLPPLHLSFLDATAENCHRGPPIPSHCPPPPTTSPVRAHRARNRRQTGGGSGLPPTTCQEIEGYHPRSTQR